jgi:hypothetical protein
MKNSLRLILTAALGLAVGRASAFEGRINATLTLSGETESFAYTIGTNYLRVERGETDRPFPQNIFNRQTGELKQPGEVMVIWATDQLLPYQPWQPNPPPRFGPRMIEDQWGGELVKAKRLFPLEDTWRFENGPERLRFEVKTVTLEQIDDRDGQRFQPPAVYHELDPLPF